MRDKAGGLSPRSLVFVNRLFCEGVASPGVGDDVTVPDAPYTSRPPPTTLTSASRCHAAPRCSLSSPACTWRAYSVHSESYPTTAAAVFNVAVPPLPVTTE
ncbi:hypothetical protein E2C01_083715 [Portunus trituberculatus]|uniref:Uncharacterized protein n=1 Tax=Portunus trituberculatus TaxID=210409 RepID=A0A5B7J8R7_PORTR|nr:hypothetical protein [Portunus trituberculatus]